MSTAGPAVEVEQRCVGLDGEPERVARDHPMDVGLRDGTAFIKQHNEATVLCACDGGALTEVLVGSPSKSRLYDELCEFFFIGQRHDADPRP